MGLGTDAAGPIDLALVENRAPVIKGPGLLHGIALIDVEAQSFVHRRRVHDLVPVEDAFRVPATLDLPHEGIDLRPVHQRDEFAAEAAVAMLAAQAPLVLPHQKRRLAGNGAEQRPAFQRLDIQYRT